MKNAVGFYWTLPVPWAGFTRLPADIEDAAAASKTIGYQRAAIREYAQKAGYRIVHEEIFLEIEPDRGSDLILGPLAKVERICRRNNATLLFVEFADFQGWRSHNPMHEWSCLTMINVEPVSAVPLRVEGRIFDPYAHFRGWRRTQREWTEEKSQRSSHARNRAHVLKSSGLNSREIAQRLNDEGLRSLSGKPWSGESLRKFLTIPKRRNSSTN